MDKRVSELDALDKQDALALHYGDLACAARINERPRAARLWELLEAHAWCKYYKLHLSVNNGNRAGQACSMRGLNRSYAELRKAWKLYCKSELTPSAACAMLREHFEINGD